MTSYLGQYLQDLALRAKDFIASDQCYTGLETKISNDLTQLYSKSGIIAIAITLLPAIIWLYFLFSDEKKRKSVMGLIFMAGMATVVPLLLMQKLFAVFPCTNFLRAIGESRINVTAGAIIIIVILAMLEEVFKQFILRFIDQKYLLVQTVNDSIKFSIIAALGFSLTENIYPYFFRMIEAGQMKELIGTYIIRSIFTTCMHVGVSGIFGYQYGISKFAIDFREESKWEGKNLYLAKFLNTHFGTPLSNAYRQQRILHGLLLAMGIHGAFNSLVSYGYVLPALLLAGGSFAYLLLLMKRKAGNLILANDISTEHASFLPKKDEDVITELIGMWFNDKRYVDVIHICERLLERDPNNNVVKLFRAKAADQLEGNDPYKKALTAVLDKAPGVEDRSILTNWIETKQAAGMKLPDNFQSAPEFLKFLEEEKKKKLGSKTFNIDLGS
jgi:RsiW-degrading membrane proteinase PrsW (M82 family)